MRTHLRTLALSGLIVLTGVALARGQGFTASITGTVSDSVGGIVPGTTVTVTNLGTGQDWTAVTDTASAGQSFGSGWGGNNPRVITHRFGRERLRQAIRLNDHALRFGRFCLRIARFGFRLREDHQRKSNAA